MASGPMKTKTAESGPPAGGGKVAFPVLTQKNSKVVRKGPKT